MPTPFYSDDAVTIWHGDALDLPLEDESVDLVVTSPPYFGLRAYSDGGETYGGQIGSEATPGEFLNALAAATREMARVLKPGGSIFVNLGDKYNSAASGQQSSLAEWSEKNARGGGGKPAKATPGRGRQVGSIPTKSLMLLPERYRIRCVDDLGLIARAVIVWDKPNGLPESVRDRVRRSHEDWVHLTKGPRYFTGIDEIREPYDAPNATRTFGKVDASRGDHGQPTARKDARDVMNPLGKLPGSVWRIPTQPLRVPPELGIDHFAAFPMEWPRRLIRGWSPSGICVECGEGRSPVAASEKVSSRPGVNVGRRGKPLMDNGGNQSREGRAGDYIATITGYACACATPTAPTRPAVILDPFMGTGTTLVVARSLGRRGVGVDLSKDYCRLAQWRVNDPAQLAKAGQVKAAKKAKVTKMRPKPAA